MSTLDKLSKIAAELRAAEEHEIIAEKDREKLMVRIAHMVRIPAGTFLMGTGDEQVKYLLMREDWANEWDSRNMFMAEQPEHTVNYSAFSIAQHAVTNIEYRPFIWSTGYKAPRHWTNFDIPKGIEEHPVVNVSWHDAIAYCKWLREQTGQSFRLPTEAEWERAARGTDGRLYPWGADFEAWRCNTAENNRRDTSPLNMYVPGGVSPDGVQDMAGNVYEWTASVLKAYPYVADDGRESPTADGKRVVRGGSWYYSRKLARCAARESLLPSYTSTGLGFRLACSA